MLMTMHAIRLAFSALNVIHVVLFHVRLDDKAKPQQLQQQHRLSTGPDIVHSQSGLRGSSISSDPSTDLAWSRR